MPDTLAAETLTASAPPPTDPPVTTPPKPKKALDPADWDVEDYELDPEIDEIPGKPQVAPAAPVKPTPAPAPPAVAPKPKHSERVRRLAKHFNFSDAEIEASDPDALLREVQAAQLEQATVLATQRQNQVPDATQTRQPQQPQTPAEPEWTIGEFTDAEGKKQKFEEALDPTFASYLKTQAQTIQQLQKELGELKQQHHHQQATTTAERFDRKFAGNESRYGKGTVREIQRGTPEAIRRVTIVGLVHQMQQAEPHAAIETLFDRAETILYGAAPAPAPVEPPVEAPVRKAPPQNPANGRFISPEQWEDAGLAAPTHRSNGAEPPSERKAIKNLDKKLREKGLDPNNLSIEEQDLPD